MKRLLSIIFAVAFGMAGHLHAEWQTKDSASLPVIVYSGNQWNPRAVPDGRNGSLIVWQDRRDLDADEEPLFRIGMAQHKTPGRRQV